MRKKESPQTKITVGELLSLAPGADEVHIMDPNLPLDKAIVYSGVIETVPEEIREGYRVSTLCADDDCILLLVVALSPKGKAEGDIHLKGEGKGRCIRDDDFCGEA